MSPSAFLTPGSHFLPHFTSQGYLATPDTWTSNYLTNVGMEGLAYLEIFFISNSFTKSYTYQCNQYGVASQIYIAKAQTNPP